MFWICENPFWEAQTTPPKIKIAPEKWWLEDDPFPLGPGNFSGAMLHFGRVSYRLINYIQLDKDSFLQQV